jgi:hypothetical protein
MQLPGCCNAVAASHHCALYTQCTAGVYRSQGTGHLQGWTNFQAAEADVPNMLVAEDE